MTDADVDLSMDEFIYKMNAEFGLHFKKRDGNIPHITEERL